MSADEQLFVWTEGKLTELRQMWADRQSAAAIAKRFNVTRNAILGKVHRLKLPSHQQVYLKHTARHRDRAKPGKPKPQPRVPKVQTAIMPDFKTDPILIRAEAWERLPGTVPVPLVELTAHTCRWPVTPEAPFLFCGAMPIDGKPYCAHHTRRAGGPPQPKMKAPGKW